MADVIDPFSFSSVIVAETYAARSIKDYFPGTKVERVIEGWQGRAEWSRAKTVEIVRWFDKNEVVTVMGYRTTDIKDKKQNGIAESVEVGRAEHGIGHCLVVPFQNKLLPGQIRGSGDIEQAVGLNQHINNLINANEEYVKQELFAPLVLIDPQKAPDDIDMNDPYSIIPINAGGNAFRLSVSTTGEQVMTQQLARGQHLIEYVTGQARVRTEGRLESSITTGRAIQKAQGPIFGRVEYRNDLNAFRLERCNELSLLLTERMFPKDDIVLFGANRRRGGMFRTTIRGSELQGYTFNKVLYSPSMFMGFEQRLIAVIQMRNAQPRPLIDERTGLEMLGLSDHPDEMMKIIEREMEEDIGFQARLRQAAEGGGSAGGDGMAPQREAVALEAGATSLPGAPAAPAVEPSAEAMATGGPMTGREVGTVSPLLGPAPPQRSGFEGAPDLEAQIRETLLGVRISGEVYLIEATPERIRVVVVPPSKNGIDGRRVGKALRDRFGERVSVRESKAVPEDATPISAREGAAV